MNQKLKNYILAKQKLIKAKNTDEVIANMRDFIAKLGLVVDEDAEQEALNILNQKIGQGDPLSMYEKDQLVKHLKL